MQTSQSMRTIRRIMSDCAVAILPVLYLENQMQNTINSAVAVVADNVAMFNGAPIESSLVETFEQLGRDYFVAEDAKAKAERTLASCDVSLFDLVKGLPYADFKTVRGLFVNGCRDKGAPTDDAAGKSWERAINRIGTSCGFERPKATSESAERMAKKRAEQAKVFEAKSDGDLDEDKTALLAKGDVKSIAKAQTIAKEIERRAKPNLDVADNARKIMRDKIIARAKELYKCGDVVADEQMVAALLAMAKLDAGEIVARREALM